MTLVVHVVLNHLKLFPLSRHSTVGAYPYWYMFILFLMSCLQTVLCSTLPTLRWGLFFLLAFFLHCLIMTGWSFIAGVQWSGIKDFIQWLTQFPAPQTCLNYFLGWVMKMSQHSGFDVTWSSCGLLLNFGDKFALLFTVLRITFIPMGAPGAGSEHPLHKQSSGFFLYDLSKCGPVFVGERSFNITDYLCSHNLEKVPQG